jgi:oxygen-independent coproporphyrinogen-3 oxidase
MSLEAINLLKDTRRPFNVDMIYGLPLQTPASFAADVDTLTSMSVPTVTTYRLRNNDRKALNIGTVAAWNNPRLKARLDDEGLFPSWEKTYQMRQAATQLLLSRGYQTSPCCFWSLPGTYPNGNIPWAYHNKWTNYDSHIAYGPGVYGWLSGAGGGEGEDAPAKVIQYHNTLKIHDYEKRLNAGDLHCFGHGRSLDGRVAVASALAFGFKSNQPIWFDDYRRRYGVDLGGEEPYASLLDKLVNKGILLSLEQDDYEEEEEGGGGGGRRGTKRKGVMASLDGEALHEEVASVYFHGYVGTPDFHVNF